MRWPLIERSHSISEEAAANVLAHVMKSSSPVIAGMPAGVLREVVGKWAIAMTEREASVLNGRWASSAPRTYASMCQLWGVQGQTLRLVEVKALRRLWKMLGIERNHQIALWASRAVASQEDPQ